ncbi:hypothetical protein V8F06_014353 [Rhypophila decipiens]
MRIILAPVVALVPAIFATVVPRQETQDNIQIVLQVSKVKDRAAIDVYNYDKSTLLAWSCSRTLQSNGLDISFEVNQNGAGNFTVGSQQYVVSDEVETSGGAICERISSATEFVVSCLVPFFGSVSAGVKARDLQTCFPDGSVKLIAVLEGFEATGEDETLISSAIDAEAQAAEAEAALVTNNTVGLKGRAPCLMYKLPFRTGNGNPHQNPWNVQLSVPMQCGNGRTCSVSYAKNYAISWSANIGAAVWGAVGFAVQTTVETGNEHTCDGNSNDYFAIWKNVGQTAYTVHHETFNGCGFRSVDSTNFIIWSPNKYDKFSYYYCVYGKKYVRNQGDRWLDTSAGRPYGP